MQTDLNALTRLGLYIFFFSFLLLLSYRVENISSYIPPLIFFIPAVAACFWLSLLRKRNKIETIHQEIIFIFIFIFLITGAIRGAIIIFPETPVIQETTFCG